MSDLRPLSVSVSRLTTETFSRKFVALGRVLSQWADLVGAEMAAKTAPVKIHYRKPKTKGEKPEASLDIGASSADAALLHYQKDLILERLNQLFGDRWITSIRFVHLAANARQDTGDELDYSRRKAAASKPIPAAEQASLEHFLETVEDEEIKKQLEKLGQSILRKKLEKKN